MADKDPLRPRRERVAETLHGVRLAVRLAWGSGPHLIVGVVAVLVLQAALPTVHLFFSKAVLDRLAADIAGVPTVGFAARYPLEVWIALAAVALALGQLAEPIAETFESMIGDRITGHIIGSVLEATNRWQGIGRFEDPAFADDLRRVREKASWEGLFIILDLSRLLLAALTTVGLALVMTRLHPLAPVVLVLAAAPQIAQQWIYNRRMGAHLYWQTTEARRLQYLRETPLSVEPAKDVRLFGLTPFFARRYDDLFERTVAGSNAIRRRLVPRAVVAAILSAGVAAGFYLFVVREIAEGRRALGDLALFGAGALMLQGRIDEIVSILGFFPRRVAFLPSLFRIVDAPPDLPVPDRPQPVPSPIVEGFRFEGVGFTYPGAAAATLSDASFTLGAGESVALVGHNGAGKTTVVKLLLRLYDPTEGRILLDGVDLREFDPVALRQRMAVVFQDFVRYELTAGENIGVGHLPALGDDARLLTAATAAGGADLIADLPQGLATPLGGELARRQLSTGEWQKLALARGFVRDAPVLVLDEPTAALDVQTEHDVYARFTELTRGRTTVLISHRFSTVRMADRILFLEGGRIAESGTHAALIANDATYARLYRLQAARYRTERAPEPIPDPDIADD